MRPRQSSLGIGPEEGGWWYDTGRFNEAEAIKPRNLDMERKSVAGAGRFNEAEAIKPRNQDFL